MNSDLYHYIQELHRFVQSQEERIRSLEGALKSMQAEVNKIKEQPPVRVDRIEYKFDQLKVETLEGTLNIGLNPSELQGIGDFSVTNQSMKAPLSPAEMMNRSIEMEESLYQYIDEHLPTIYADTIQQLQVELDDSYLSFIKEDIKKQIPKRVEHYFHEFVQMDDRTHSNDQVLLERMVDRLHQEMVHGVRVFIDTLPAEVKGGNQE